MSKEITWQHIDRIGIEFEGGWDTEPDDMKGDGSVDIPGYNGDSEEDCCCDEDYECDNHGGGEGVSGEVASQPLHAEDVWPTIQKYCPDAVNRTCGLHVHISFKQSYDYERLSRPVFWRYFRQHIYQWAKTTLQGDKLTEFMRRFEGRNNYCKAEFMPIKPDCRYKQLNFAAMRDHGTIEVRLLPAFDNPETIFSAVSALVSIFDTYLDKAAPPDEISLSGSLEVELDDLEIQYHEVIAA
jgi:hypothetical protein